MTTVTKSITRLLAERTGLEGRIREAIGGEFVRVSKGTGASKEIVGATGVSVVDMEKRLKGNFDRVESLIAYHRRITAAIIKSNAEVKVTIGGETITVAEAIERKRSITYTQEFLAGMRLQTSMKQGEVDRMQTLMTARIDEQVKQLLSADKGNITPDKRSTIANPIEEAQKPGLVDPNNLYQKIEEYAQYLQTFNDEIDFCLSESNAKTEITLDDAESAPAKAEETAPAAA